MNIREKFNEMDLLQVFIVGAALGMFVGGSLFFFVGVVIVNWVLMLVGAAGIFIAGYILMDMFGVDI